MLSKWWSLPLVVALLAVGFSAIFHWDLLFAPAKPEQQQEQQPQQLYSDFNAWLNAEAWRYHPLDGLPFTPLLTCEPNASSLMSRFDWKIVPESAWRDGNSPNGTHESCGPVDDLPWVENISVAEPKTIWAAPHALHRLLEIAAERLDPAKAADRVVVFSGTEYPISRAFGRNESELRATVRQLQKYFKRILYQTMDVYLEGVGVAPMGLCWGYMMVTLFEWAFNKEGKPLHQAFIDFAATLRGGLSTKSREVLATKGMVAGWLWRESTMTYLKFLERMDRAFPPSNSSLKAVATAYESRMRLRAWLRVSESSEEVTNPAAIAAGVEFRYIPVAKWWQELAKYKFLLSPLGSGLQAAKSIEALLVLTIPVIQRMSFKIWNELVRLGFPFVLVWGWVEVTPANTSRWWQALSPRLESFRKNCLSVEGYWRMYTGQVAFCA